MKTKFILLLLSIITLSGFMLINQKSKYRILCFGDSITYGAGVEGNGWVEQIANKYDNLIMINEGRKGRKTADKEELLPILEKHKDVDLILILLGVNDLKNGNDSLVNSCVLNMKWMITQIKNKLPDTKILLLSPCSISLETMTDLNKQKKYNENTYQSLIKLEKEYEKLANEENIYFMSLFNVVSLKNFYDGVHPDLAGHKEIAEKVSEKISSILDLKID